jgi:hypothetical protein
MLNVLDFLKVPAIFLETSLLFTGKNYLFFIPIFVISVLSFSLELYIIILFLRIVHYNSFYTQQINFVFLF